MVLPALLWTEVKPPAEEEDRRSDVFEFSVPRPMAFTSWIFPLSRSALALDDL